MLRAYLGRVAGHGRIIRAGVDAVRNAVVIEVGVRQPTAAHAREELSRQRVSELLGSGGNSWQIFALGRAKVGIDSPALADT